MNSEKNGESLKETVRSLLHRMSSRQWVTLLLLGLLLAVIALPTSDKKKENEGEEESQIGFLTETKEESSVSKTQLEEKLEALLSSVEGVGKVQVILMTGEEEDDGGFYHSGEQKVTGVLIAAQGADDSVVSQNLVQAVMALFQVEAHKIKIMKLN